MELSSKLILLLPGSSFEKHHRIYRLLASKGNYYNCLDNYCPCRSYYEINKSSPVLVWCKHLLAIRLAIALNCVEETVLPDQEFIHLTSNLLNEG